MNKMLCLSGEVAHQSKAERKTYPVKGEHMKTPKVKKGFEANLEKETLKNDDFRRVLYTGKNSQLVLMNLRPGEDRRRGP